MSRRSERVASVVRGVVAEAIQAHLSDPRIEPLTSITRVELTPDLSVAHIHVSVMAPPPRRKLCVTALQHAAGKLRGMLAETLTLRQAPMVRFHLDESLQRGFETVQTIDRLMEELGPPQGTEAGSSGSGEDAAAAGASLDEDGQAATENNNGRGLGENGREEH